MNQDDLDVIWTEAAWLTYERMPPDVQAGIDQAIEDMMERYAPIYQQRPTEECVVGTVSHMQVPDWGIWLRFDTDYTELEAGPSLRINALEELTKAELDASVAAVRASSDRIR